LWEAAKNHPECCIFGGKVLPQWPSPPPEWLAKNSRNLLQGIAIHYDQGDKERYISSIDILPFGANLAIRRSVFAGKFCFREDIGPKGSELTTHDETDLIRRMIIDGNNCIYIPSAIVNHRNPVYRMTERHLRRWYRGSGMSLVRMGEIAGSRHQLFGAPRYLWRSLIESFVSYVLTRWTRPSGVWLRAEIRMAETCGMIIEFRKQSRLRNQTVNI